MLLDRSRGSAIANLSHDMQMCVDDRLTDRQGAPRGCQMMSACHRDLHNMQEDKHDRQ